ncbi:hypothetical protein MK489_19830 [Myxococcota bacterium]|nr:hypothetical protein [Myxococcota bacterium]
MSTASSPLPRGMASHLTLATAVLVSVFASSCVGGSGQNPPPDAHGVPVPRVEGPVTGGKQGFPFIGTAMDLAAQGYVEEEFFLAGTARTFASEEPLTADGHWTVTPAGRAPYRTRVLIRRPENSADFNGTVLVEWLNVSGGLDAGPDWAFLHALILRDGYAWVGVSAQAVGVHGFPPDHPRSALGNAGALTVWDSSRYATLTHPGDSYSYDLYAQVGRALREPQNTELLGGAKVEELIAIGESQSASRLATYVNSVHPRVQVYDAFLIHSRGGGAAPLTQAPEFVREPPRPVRIRDDLAVPVLAFATETDLIGLSFYPARQPDTSQFRLWEAAGTAHADLYQLTVAMRDSNRTPVGNSAVTTCDLPLNDGPQHYVLKAAVHHLRNWSRYGTLPPAAPRLRVVPSDPPQILRDGYGNALGGIRTAPLDVPTKTLSGEGNSGGVFCRLFGVTAPFEPETLTALYGSEDAYRTAFDQAVEDAVAAGFVLEADAAQMRAEGGFPNGRSACNSEACEEDHP